MRKIPIYLTLMSPRASLVSNKGISQSYLPVSLLIYKCCLNTSLYIFFTNFNLLWFSWVFLYLKFVSLFYFMSSPNSCSSDQYHPVLDTRSKIFMQKARQFMAQATLSSSLRFQNFELTFDTSHIFLIGTIVEQAPFIGKINISATYFECNALCYKIKLIHIHNTFVLTYLLRVVVFCL